MKKNTITNIIRHYEIEHIIDEKCYLQLMSYSTESIFCYLNTLEKLVNSYNNEGKSYKGVHLYDFIKINRPQLERINLEIFSNEESDYIKAVKIHIKNIRGIFKKYSHTRNELIEYIFYIMEKSAKEMLSSVEVLDKLKSELMTLNTATKLYLCKNKQNLCVFLKRFDYYICLIRDEASYNIVDRRYLCSVIIDTDHPNIYTKLKESSNIDFLSVRNEFGNFESIQTNKPLLHCMQTVSKLIHSAERKISGPYSNIVEMLLELRDEIEKLAYNYDEIITKTDILRLDDIKQLRRKTQNYSYNIEKLLEAYGENKFTQELNLISNLLSITFNRVVNVLNLDNNINYSLSEIKRNNTLYIVSGGNKKNSEYIFGEENLTSILASNLRCLYKKHRDISVHCEAMVGNGRSDIRLSFKTSAFGLVESKLIRDKSNIFNESMNAIEQLYSRYSENESISGDSNMKLYLILFTYDKSFSAIQDSIYEAVSAYSKRNSIEYEKIDETESSIKFSYCEDRGVFRKKYRTISILVCNMEVDYKTRSKQRTSNKNYDPSI